MVILCASGLSAAQYTITDLGSLGGGGTVFWGINDSGIAVGDSGTSRDQDHAFMSWAA